MKVSDIKPQDKSVWVLNNSKGTTRGPVIFTLPRHRGNGNDTVVVPNTFVPIDLVEQVTAGSLKDSTEFRRCLRTGLLRLIEESEATKLLSAPGAAAEIKRLGKELHFDIQQQVGMPVVESVVDTIKVELMCQQLTDGELEEEDVVSELRLILTDLTNKDRQYILECAKDNKWAGILSLLQN